MTLARRALSVALACLLTAACGGGGRRPEPQPTPTPNPNPNPSPHPDPSPSPGLCSPDRFCWLDPLPFGESLTGTFVASATDVWAVGQPGHVLRFDGTRWTRLSTGAAWRTRAVWGSGPADVYVVGEAILRWDGTRFTEVHRAPGGRAFRAVHGSGPRDVWAVGEGGVAARFDGTAWRDLPIATNVPADTQVLTGVFVLPGGTAYATPLHGGVPYAFSGGAWSPMNVEGLEMRSLEAVWASSPTDVWLAGAGSYTGRALRGHGLSHWDGTRWTGHRLPGLERATFSALAGEGPADLWAVTEPAGGDLSAAHWDGAAWTPARLGAAVAELHVNAAGEGLAVGPGGAVARLSGGAWTVLLRGSQDFLQDVAARGGVAWVAGRGLYPADAALVRIDGAGVRALSLGRQEIVYGVSPLGPDDVWAATYGSGLAHWDGAAWSFGVGGIGGPVRGVYAAGPGAIWALLGDRLVRWNGAAATTYAVDARYLERAWGASPDDVWAVGDVGSAHHWDGAAWTKVPLPGGKLTFDVWGRARDDVWIVGYEGYAARFDGTTWREVATGTTAALQRVFGDGAGRVWIVGWGGLVLEWDGSRLRALDPGSTGWLMGGAWDPALGIVVAGPEGILRRAP